MHTTLFSVALFASVAVQGALAAFNMHTPDNVAACESVRLAWTDGTPGFNLIVVPQADPCSETLATVGDFDQWHTDWTPPAELAGQTVLFSLEDKDGNEAWSEAITIGDSCNQSSSGSASAAPSPSGSASGAALTASPSEPAKSVGSSNPTPSTSVKPVGAAGAGIGSKTNGASGAARAPALVLGALGAVLAFAL